MKHLSVKIGAVDSELRSLSVPRVEIEITVSRAEPLTLEEAQAYVRIAADTFDGISSSFYASTSSSTNVTHRNE